MTEDEQKQFKQPLDEIAEDIRTQLAIADPSKESITPDKSIGRLTRMEAIQSQSMTNEGRRRMEKRLAMVERALERIEKGSFGRCASCGEEIPRGRLEIMPEAPFCVTCSSRR